MEEEATARAVPRPRWKILGEGLLGFAFGYLLLHPVAMEVVRWLEPGAIAGAAGRPPTLANLFGALTSVLHADMVPMGLIFGGLSGVLAGVNGAYRLSLGAQRDLLARQLEATDRFRQRLERALERVRAQNVRLARLEQARRRTARFMVHDFKTHLGCIIGFSDLLLRAPADVPMSQHGDALRRIRRQGLRMMHAVTDLLDLDRLQERPQLKRRAVRPTDLLREVADDLGLPVERGRVELGPYHRGCPPVFGDRRLLVRVLSNLAANAVKHNPPGIHIVLDASLLGADPGYVRFSCRDDGLGVPASLLGTVFDEFHSGLAEGPEASSGIGLAFCKAAVEAHGGRICFETKEGEGASFHFMVPVAQEPHETWIRCHEDRPSPESPAGTPDDAGRARRAVAPVADRRAQKGESE